MDHFPKGVQNIFTFPLVEALLQGTLSDESALTDGPWKDSNYVRGDAQPYTEEFKECVALMAQYIYDTFGKIPPTVPTSLIATYLQAHHLDLDFYDHYYKPGAYLHTHKEHMKEWH